MDLSLMLTFSPPSCFYLRLPFFVKVSSQIDLTSTPQTETEPVGDGDESDIDLDEIFQSVELEMEFEKENN